RSGRRGRSRRAAAARTVRDGRRGVFRHTKRSRRDQTVDARKQTGEDEIRYRRCRAAASRDARSLHRLDAARSFSRVSRGTVLPILPGESFLPDETFGRRTTHPGELRRSSRTAGVARMSTQQQTFGFLSGGQRPAAVQTAEGGRPPRQNVVIEAGAGTGKTTAIVAKVLDLLLGDDDVAPERMVLVTFTEKAAGEIADRIQSALTEIERGADRWPVNSDRPLFQVGPAARRAVER